MRDIKFRAWIYGGIDKGEKPFMEYISTLVWEVGGMRIGWTRWEEESFPGEYALMQYTGLKDKNDKEIYEGDIVYLGGYGDYVAEWPFIQLYEASFEKDIGSILGNIYENPEMLGHL